MTIHNPGEEQRRGFVIDYLIVLCAAGCTGDGVFLWTGFLGVSSSASTMRLGTPFAPITMTGPDFFPVVSEPARVVVAVEPVWP